MNLTFFELEHFALASWMLLIVYDIRMRVCSLGPLGVAFDVRRQVGNTVIQDRSHLV